MELKESATDLTIHWLGRIARTRSKATRLFWISLMIASLGILFSLSGLMTSEYLKYGILIKEESIIPTELALPAVTICGPILSKQKLLENADNLNISLDFNESAAAIGVNRYLRKEAILRKLENEEKLLKVAPDDESFFLKKLHASCKMGTHKPCNFSSDFLKSLVIYRGYCYTFNPNGTRMVFSSGRDEAVSFVMFFNISDFVPWFEHDMGDSVDIIVHNHKDYPFLTSSVLGPVGQITQIEIRRTEVNRKEQPYSSGCTNREGDHAYFPGSYSVLQCQTSCFLSKVSKQCNRFDFFSNIFMPKDKRMPFTNGSKQTRCLAKVIKHLRDSNFESCNCKLPCHEVKYDKTVSYSKWPSETDIPIYKQLFSKALDLNASEVADDFVRRNFLRIDVYYGDMMYRMISEEESYSFGKLIGDIGGYMGLLVGASVFSLLELIVLIGQTIFAMMAARTHRNNDLNQ